MLGDEVDLGVEHCPMVSHLALDLHLLIHSAFFLPFLLFAAPVCGVETAKSPRMLKAKPPENYGYGKPCQEWVERNVKRPFKRLVKS